MVNRYILSNNDSYNTLLAEAKRDTSLLKKYGVSVNDDGSVYDSVSKLQYNCVIEWIKAVTLGTAPPCGKSAA